MKNKVVWKWFFIWQWEEEEAWLNRMSEEGWHFTDVKFIRYRFEQGTPGAYQYRLEALESNDFSRPETQEYLSFMRDTGAEYIGHMMYWAYFRKKKDDGPFEIFSDIDSRLHHLERFERIPLGGMSLLFINFLNCFNLIAHLNAPAFGGFLLGLNTMLLVLLGYCVIQLRRKRRELEAERQLHE